MSRCYPEPTVAEALADPLIRLIMRADRVDADALGRALNHTAAKLASRMAPTPTEACCGSC